jgi:lipid-A-disaccharide synthase
MVDLVRAWASTRPEVQWVLPVASTLDTDFVDQFVKGTAIRTVRERGYAARAHADAALVCSGTATLETALLGTPFAVLYKLNPLTLLLLKRLVKTPYFGLANIVAGRRIVTELLQAEVNPQRLSKELERLLDPAVAASMRIELSEVRKHLGEPGAAGRVAEHLLSKLGR